MKKEQFPIVRDKQVMGSSLLCRRTTLGAMILAPTTGAFVEEVVPLHTALVELPIDAE